MNWITKLERKFGRYCIPNLISILIGGQILVYAVELFVNQYISFYLNLDRGALLAGQIWRVITFMFVPFSGGGPLSVVLGIYFTGVSIGAGVAAAAGGQAQGQSTGHEQSKNTLFHLCSS